MKQVEKVENIQEQVKTCLTEFMEENKSFNLQGSFTNEQGLTVNLLIDFGIEDRDNGRYYVGSVYSKMQDNLEYLEEKGLISEPEKEGPSTIEEIEPEKLREVLGESDLFIEIENHVVNGIRQVYDLPYTTRLTSRPELSDVDVSSTIPIVYGNWKTKKSVDFDRLKKREQEAW